MNNETENRDGIFAVAISGPKGSGKTSSANFLSRILGLKVWSARLLIEDYIINSGSTVTHNTKLHATEELRKRTSSGSVFEFLGPAKLSVVVDSVISKADVMCCASQFKTLYHVHVWAEPMLRLSRIHERNRQDDTNLTLAQMQQVEARDDVASLSAMAKLSIENNRSLQELHAQLISFASYLKRGHG